jgi:hypothetical protein
MLSIVISAKGTIRDGGGSGGFTAAVVVVVVVVVVLSSSGVNGGGASAPQAAVTAASDSASMSVKSLFMLFILSRARCCGLFAYFLIRPHNVLY